MLSFSPNRIIVEDEPKPIRGAKRIRNVIYDDYRRPHDPADEYVDPPFETGEFEENSDSCEDEYDVSEWDEDDYDDCEEDAYEDEEYAYE